MEEEEDEILGEHTFRKRVIYADMPWIEDIRPEHFRASRVACAPFGGAVAVLRDDRVWLAEHKGQPSLRFYTSSGRFISETSCPWLCGRNVVTDGGLSWTNAEELFILCRDGLLVRTGIQGEDGAQQQQRVSALLPAGTMEQLQCCRLVHNQLSHIPGNDRGISPSMEEEGLHEGCWDIQVERRSASRSRLTASSSTKSPSVVGVVAMTSSFKLLLIPDVSKMRTRSLNSCYVRSDVGLSRMVFRVPSCADVVVMAGGRRVAGGDLSLAQVREENMTDLHRYHDDPIN